MTEDQKAKIRWLNRAFHAEKAAQAWLAKLERDRSDAERITRSFSGNGGGNASGNSTEDALVRLADTERETQQRLNALAQIREEITAAIASVDDLGMQAILVRHYLTYEKWEIVAKNLNYDESTVKRKHKKALDKIAIECHPVMC